MLVIHEVRSKKDLDTFITFPSFIYKGDPSYSPQLTRDLRTHYSTENPFFKTAEVRLFLAFQDEKVVGRIASIINHRHIEFQKERAGFFGLFECVNDPTVSSLLFDRVAQELKKAGMEAMRGPMDLSTNEQCGFLCEGFGMPPMLMTPYNPPYYNDLASAWGMEKAKDLLAFIHEVKPALPDKVLRVAALAERKGLKARPIDKKNFIADMQKFKEIYNEAWHANWSFIPMDDEELSYSAHRLKPLVIPDLISLVESGDEPVGFLGLIPDFNSVLRHMQGKLNPITALKALYYSRKISDLRLLLLGIKTEYRNKGVDALLFREAFKGVKRGNYKRIEFSWILEDNLPVIRLAELIGGTLYKRFRVYEKKVSEGQSIKVSE